MYAWPESFSTAMYVGDWRLWIFLAIIVALFLAVLALAWRPTGKQGRRGKSGANVAFSGGFLAYADGNAGDSVNVGTGLGPSDAFPPIVLGNGAFVAATAADFQETLSSLAWTACNTGAVRNLNVVLTDAIAQTAPQTVTATVYQSPACGGSFVATALAAAVIVSDEDPASYCINNVVDIVNVNPGDRIALLISAGTTAADVVFLNINGGLQYDFAPGF
jgi:hypothetical protein